MKCVFFGGETKSNLAKIKLIYVDFMSLFDVLCENNDCFKLYCHFRVSDCVLSDDCISRFRAAKSSNEIDLFQM